MLVAVLFTPLSTVAGSGAEAETEGEVTESGLLLAGETGRAITAVCFAINRVLGDGVVCVEDGD